MLVEPATPAAYRKLAIWIIRQTFDEACRTTGPVQIRAASWFSERCEGLQFWSAVAGLDSVAVASRASRVIAETMRRRA